MEPLSGLDCSCTVEIKRYIDKSIISIFHLFEWQVDTFVMYRYTLYTAGGREKEGRKEGRRCNWALGITLIEFTQMEPSYHEMLPMRLLLRIGDLRPYVSEEYINWCTLIVCTLIVFTLIS